VVHILDSIYGTLFRCVGNKSTAFTLSIGVPQHGAFFYRAVRTKHHPDVILRALLRQHPHEQFTFISVFTVSWFHLYWMMHPCQRFDVVQRVLSIQCRLSCEEGHETASFTLASDLIPQHVDLVYSSELLEHLTEIIFVHGARNLTYKHFDEVWIRLL
jgi:hypothetical protein